MLLHWMVQAQVWTHLAKVTTILLTLCPLWDRHWATNRPIEGFMDVEYSTGHTVAIGQGCHGTLWPYKLSWWEQADEGRPDTSGRPLATQPGLQLRRRSVEEIRNHRMVVGMDRGGCHQTLPRAGRGYRCVHIFSNPSHRIPGFTMNEASSVGVYGSTHLSRAVIV